MSQEEMATDAEMSDASPADEETEEVVEETDEVSEDESEDTEGETVDEDEDEPSAEQRKTAELAYKLREAKRQNARMLRLLEQQEARQAQANAPKPPKLEDFETIDDFVDAKVAYAMKQGQPPQDQTPSADNSADMAEFEVAREDMVANGIAKHPDFAEVVLAEDVDITLAMANALVDMDDSDLQVDTAYYLGSNPKEASRIAKLSPSKQIAEVAKLSAKIAGKRAKPAKQPSKAPKPIEPVKGKKVKSDELQPDDDMKTFIAKRNKQLGRV